LPDWLPCSPESRRWRVFCWPRPGPCVVAW
jgi:hypothetical protein